MIYQEFAELYDELFDPTMYDKWLDFVEHNANADDDILDVACGTGRLISLLRNKKYNVSGLDMSSDMLTIADDNLRRNNQTANLIQGDMLDLSSFPNYEVITCFDDSLCYLKNLQELKIAFENAYNHLNNKGKYLFDVITPYQTDQIYPGYMYNFHDETRAFMWTTYIGDEEHSVDHDLSFFNYNEELDAYDEFSELHHERTYNLEDYISSLESVGFSKVNVFSNFGKNKIDENTTRWFFICEK
ncbi:class I SAM-dependent DNA methyltransferase [Apilactobacillus micheneri]|uniref:class I SAM-dependent DNA methyltransferase n=1 Tax=Apilactobacillus micheneri TaxID=1899430 RepID=UPI000D51F07A|nr:class I SAM-dependent methyltransferase [Apilactobacillus micheneri]GAY80072.1 dTDP-3-amino-3,6-dideoxy-alpha-D-glucopyranose N,N-dimethyltransferase [Apilactobacillus micheneri]